MENEYLIVAQIVEQDYNSKGKAYRADISRKKRFQGRQQPPTIQGRHAITVHGIPVT